VKSVTSGSGGGARSTHKAETYASRPRVEQPENRRLKPAEMKLEIAAFSGHRRGSCPICSKKSKRSIPGGVEQVPPGSLAGAQPHHMLRKHQRGEKFQGANFHSVAWGPEAPASFPNDTVVPPTSVTPQPPTVGSAQAQSQNGSVGTLPKWDCQQPPV